MTKPSAHPFTALVRWRSESAPGVELESHHRGFQSAEAAALAANGLGGDGFDELLLEDGTVTLRREGMERDCTDVTVFVWLSVSLEIADVPPDWAFERLDGPLQDVPELAGRDRFVPLSFRVIDDSTGNDIGIDFVIMPGGVALVTAAVFPRTSNANIAMT